MSHQYSSKFYLGQTVMHNHDPMEELVIKEIHITSGSTKYTCCRYLFGSYRGDTTVHESSLSAEMDKDSRFPILISTRGGPVLCMSLTDVPTAEPFKVLHTKVKVLGK